MEFKDLSKNELLAFVGLMDLVLIADRDITLEEQSILSGFINEIGEHNYRSIVLEYNQSFKNTERFKIFLISIVRQEAQEFIYGSLFEIAGADYVHHKESEILDWVAKEWSIDVQYNSHPD